MSRSIKMKVRFTTIPKAIVKLGVDNTGDVQNKLTDMVFDNMRDFMPRRSGTLISSMRKRSPTLIRVDSDYAKMLYFGRKMKDPSGGGPFPVGDGEYRYRKGARPVKTWEPLSYGRPNSGPFWDRLMVAARGKAIAAAMQRYVDRRKS